MYMYMYIYFRFSAMAKTRELLRDGKYSECIALVRSARYSFACVTVCVCVCVQSCLCVSHDIYLTREVWPDDVFGTEGMDVVEQRGVLKKIFLDPVSGVLLLLCVCVCVLYVCVVCSCIYIHSSQIAQHCIELMSAGIADAAQDDDDEGMC